jgi:leucyl-tRNA synthetase
LQRAIHRAIRDAEQQIEAFRFNTLVASLMQMTSQLEEVWPRLGSRTRAEAPRRVVNIVVD